MERRLACLLSLLLLNPALSCSTHADDGLGSPDLLDRRMVAEELQNYSDYGGWEARFAVDGADGTTLVMTGSLLCAPDFPQLVPPHAWALVPEAGFTSFRCRLPDGGSDVELEVARPEP
jgi:hypothetical protein